MPSFFSWWRHRRERAQARAAAWTQAIGPDGLKPHQHVAKDRVEALISALDAQIHWSTKPGALDSAAILVGTAASLSLRVGLGDDQFSYTLGEKYDYIEGIDYESPAAMTDKFISQLRTAFSQRS